MVVAFLIYVFWITLGLVAYSYFLYPLLVRYASKFFGSPVTKNLGDYPHVAFVVPIYNEEKVILQKINNILSLTYPSNKLSIYIGSDCSTDKTHEILAGLSYPRIHLWIAPLRGGKTEVINKMTDSVDCDIIVFTDANTMHRPDCLTHLIAPFADSRVGCVAGQIEHRAPSTEVSGEVTYRSFESNQKYAEGLLSSTISAYGGFFAIRKHLFKPIPFNAYSNDDVLIPMNIIRNGYRVIFEPMAISDEETTNSRTIEFRRRIRIGAGNFQSFFWLLDFLNPRYGWVTLCYVSHKVIRWFSPLLLVCSAISCTLLAILSAGNIYTILALCAAGFVAAGLFHKLLPFKFTKAIFYFLSMNTALGLGFFKYCKGIKSAAWSRTDRN